MRTQLNIDGVTKDHPVSPADKRFREAWEWDGPAVVIHWGKALTHFRSTATMSKDDFVNRAVDMNILTDSEGIQVVCGHWPMSFNHAIAALSLQQHREATVAWAGCMDVARLSSICTLILTTGKANDQQLDTLFGYGGQYPAVA